MSEYPTYLIHYGVPGQKWGVRQYQLEDGTWTEEGLRRRRKDNYKYLKEATKIHNKWDRKDEGIKRAKELTKNFSDEYKKSFNEKVKNVKTRQDLRKLSLNDIEDLKIDKEVENIIGKYANKKFDKRMNDTYGDILKESEFNRLYDESREKYIKGYEKKIPKMEKELKDADMITEDRYWKLWKNGVSEEEIFNKDKRLDDAAITGLKALEGKDADLSAGNKFWFVCEDQTIGYTTIADLANRGYSEKQIKDLVNTANEYYYNPIHDETASDLGMKMPKGTWHLTELYDGDKFIEDCVKVVKEEKEGKTDIKINKNALSNKEVDELQSDIDWSKENYEFREDILKDTYPKLEKAIKDADLLESSSKIWWLKEDQASDFFKSNKRIDDATNLAMKAVGNDWIKENVRQHDKPTKLAFLQESMNYPDDSRASGLVQIADMANRGYTKDQIINAIRVSSMISFNYDNRPDGSKIPNKDSLNDISMYSPESREKFIDKCLELSDSKQSQIKSLIASGKSQEEVAKMLGVSTSTVNKYK